MATCVRWILTITKYFNFLGNEVNTEQTNPDFLFAVNIKYTAATMPSTAVIMPIGVHSLTHIQSKDQAGSDGASISHMVALEMVALTVGKQWL